MAGFSNLLETKGRRGIVQGVPASFNVHLGVDRPVETLADTFAVDAEGSMRLVLALQERGVRGIPGGHWYLSAAHTDALVEETLDAFEDALDAIA